MKMVGATLVVALGHFPGDRKGRRYFLFAPESAVVIPNPMKTAPVT